VVCSNIPRSHVDSAAVVHFASRHDPERSFFLKTRAPDIWRKIKKMKIACPGPIALGKDSEEWRIQARNFLLKALEIGCAQW
jgi:hypothetical protein